MTNTSTRGSKHLCSHCNTRFYDLNRRPTTCPKCNHRVTALKTTSRRTRRRTDDGTEMKLVNVPSPMARNTKIRLRSVKWR